MKIDCLMGTYGRFSFACEAVACFLSQTALQNAKLLVYNQHPTPLYFDHDRVRVVNVENPPGTTLRDVRSQMLALANPEADLLHFWDDDDLYLPWHLEDCLTHIGNNVAWKPHSSWMLRRGRQYQLSQSVFEATWAFQSDYLKNSAQDSHPESAELPVYVQTINDNLLATTELHGRSSFIYRWNEGQVNHSSLQATGTRAKQVQVLKYMRSASNDIRKDGKLYAPDMTIHWQHFLNGTQNQVTPQEYEANRQALGLPDYQSPASRSLRSALRRLSSFFKT